MNIHPRARLAAALMCTTALLITGASAASAAPDALQSRVDAILAEHPGGTQVAANEISWEGGEVVLTLESQIATLAVGSCATGLFCAYTGGSLTGTRVSFTNCSGTNSVSVLGAPVRSVANARTSGTVHAYNGTTSVLSVAASSMKNTTATITRLGC